MTTAYSAVAAPVASTEGVRTGLVGAAEFVGEEFIGTLVVGTLVVDRWTGR